VIPVTQTILGPPNGNCLPACIASILELPLGKVPNHHGYNWWNRLVEWGKRHGYDICCYAPDERPAEAEWWISSPLSPRHNGVYHAVVMHHEELAWDPHPSARPGALDLSTSEDCIVIWSLRDT
jgi:hypothetical protein